MVVLDCIRHHLNPFHTITYCSTPKIGNFSVKMGKLHREWVQSVALKKGLNVDAVESAGGELFTSGSYRYVYNL